MRPSSFCHIAAAVLAGTASLCPPAAAQLIPRAPATASYAPAPEPLAYADYADLVVASPLMVDATIRSASRIKGAEAANVPAGRQRFFVEADVVALVRGTAAIPARIGWVVDVDADARGRVPRLKKQRVLAFARPVAGRPTLLQLVAPDAQRAWSPAADALVRHIADEANAPDAPPAITGVRSAFFVAGALPGEGDTQVFLTTAGDRPAALSIERRAESPPRWSVALGEVIDAAATVPPRDTLLWYRLACGLPANLPDEATAALEPEARIRAATDYRFVVEQLGPCRPGEPLPPATSPLPTAPAAAVDASPAPRLDDPVPDALPSEPATPPEEPISGGAGPG